MGAATHAGIVGADDFFALEFHLRLFHIHVLADELGEVELDCDLVLTGGDDDLAALNDAFVVDFQLMVERAARGFDQSDADTGFGDELLRRFEDECFLLEEIYRFVYRVEDLDRLCQVVVEDIVGGKNFERLFGIVFGARVKTGRVDIEARDRTHAVGFTLKGIGGGLGIGKDDVLQVIAVARFIDDEALHIPEVAFEVRKFGVAECGIVALSNER